MSDIAVKTSIEASLFIQILTFLVNGFSFFIPLDVTDFALKEILGLETFVQSIELVFYLWYRRRLLEKTNDVTRFRYYDWFLTTPMMLFSTASYYGYLYAKDTPSKEPFSVWTFFQEHKTTFILIFLLNALMLLFGYLQELGLISLLWSSLFGYASLIGSFGLLYKEFVTKVPLQQGLFSFMFAVWSLYGVAALFPSREKNISYNVLDIFAKNFYGLFLSSLIFQKKV